QQRLLQLGNAGTQRLRPGVSDELPRDRERPAGERHLRLAAAVDVVGLGLEMPQHMGDVGGGADGGYRLRLGDTMRRGQDGGAAERMTDENGGSGVVLPQMVGGTHQVLDIGGEVGTGELLLGRAESGEVEPQDAYAQRGEPTRDAAGGKAILGACEAVREERVGPDRAGWRIEAGGKLVAETAGKADADRGHADGSLAD